MKYHKDEINEDIIYRVAYGFETHLRKEKEMDMDKVLEKYSR